MISTWQNVNGSNCLLSLDYNSQIQKESEIIPQTDSSLKLVSEKPNSIFKGYSLGKKVKNFQPIKRQEKTLYEYKSLICKSNLKLSKNLFYPKTNELTIVLKLKITKPINILFNSKFSGIYGLVFSYFKNIWSFSPVAEGYVSNELVSRDNFTFSTYIEDVVFKVNMNSNEGELKTNYGKFSLDLHSIKMDPNFFINTDYFDTIGSTNSTKYSFDSEIIALGIFDKCLTEDQITSMYQKIDLDFLTNSFEEESELQEIYISSKYLLQEMQAFLYSKYSRTLNFELIEKYEKPVKIFSQVSISNNTFKKSNIQILENSKRVSINYPRIKENLSKIEGLVTEEGRPISVKLFLYDRISGALISKTYSNKEGRYVFKNIDRNREYIVTSYDKKYQFKSIIKDFTRENYDGR